MDRLELGLTLFFAPLVLLMVGFIGYAIAQMIDDKEWGLMAVMFAVALWIGTVIWLVIP
jgi:hypothetical protein